MRSAKALRLDRSGEFTPGAEQILETERIANDATDYTRAIADDRNCRGAVPEPVSGALPLFAHQPVGEQHGVGRVARVTVRADLAP
jgi:hypothetical protein